MLFINPFEADQNVGKLRALRESVRAGILPETLETCPEFQKATNSLNAIVHAVEAVDDKERINKAFFNALLNRNK